MPMPLIPDIAVFQRKLATLPRDVVGLIVR